MNYRITKNSNSNLIHYQFNKSITHNKASIILLKTIKHFINGCDSFLKSLFSSKKYTCDESYTNRPCNTNFYHEDITDLQLKASQRTFL